MPAMQTLQLELDNHAYPIHIGEGLLANADLIKPALKGQKRAVVVTNETVAPLYLAQLQATLASLDCSIVPIVLPDGEHHKNWQTLNLIYEGMLRANCERKTPVIALGGGVVGDMAGFAAATYQRGVPFIQVPTTLLSQVDSSVGGKTAINHELGKNMIGAFYQPNLVLADTSVLATLSDRELRAGLAEVIKYGILGDLPFFEWLEQNIDALIARDTDALQYAIKRSCEDKARIVEADEKEGGVRALLNLGHTFGHAIETGLGYGAWLHGEAVAAGMVIAADVSRRLGILGAAEQTRIVELIRRARLPTQSPDLGIDRYLELMGHDKKVESGKIRFVLVSAIGQAVIRGDVPESVLGDAITACLA